MSSRNSTLALARSGGSEGGGGRGTGIVHHPEFFPDDIVKARKNVLTAVAEREKSPTYEKAVNEQIFKRHYRDLRTLKRIK